ncbi:S-layer homology domain-containing protein [Paenibacillus filicis]|uniref:S-layer homology domain-containing protein n=1 Tax=Paenibacillus gyeongsangnamensis TaxID=3388067 RepID=A0ABT4QDA1_9BACL|nr:S-layer homology domain-containing protein [Paenibacillus filicis]MCZ8514857.1 S-layer homology domain-containing protein [Paenibacillus filicis]
MKNETNSKLSLGLVLLLIFTFLLPAKPVEAGPVFSDVDKVREAWAVDSINTMARNQVLTGYPDGTFHPGQPISKAEWTAMIYRLFDKYRPNLYASGLNKIDAYADMSPQHWAYRPVMDVFTRDLKWGTYGTNSFGQLIFGPDMQLNRLQLASLLSSFFDTRMIDRRIKPNDACSVVSEFRDIPYRFYKEPADYDKAAQAQDRMQTLLTVATVNTDVVPLLFMGSNGSDCSFGSENYSNDLANALTSLQASGIMTATSEGYFRPLDKVTRVEAVTILNRVYNYLFKNNWLFDYSTKKLDDSAAADPSGAGTGQRGGASYPTGSAYGGGTGSTTNPSNVRITDYFKLLGSGNQGTLTKNIGQNGEIETAVMPSGYKYLTLDLKSQDKVDLKISLDGSVILIKQEDFPKTILVDGVKTVGLNSQVRIESPTKRTGNATLTVKLSNDAP